MSPLPLLLLALLLLLGPSSARQLPPPKAPPALRGGAPSPPAPRPSPLQLFFSTVSSNRRFLLSGGAARFASILAMYPLDTFKTRLQLKQPLNVANAFSSPAGVAELFRGAPNSLLGQVPYAVLTFGGYEVYKRELLARLPGLPRLPTYVAAAVLGDLTGSAWLCPSEVIKQGLQGGVYPSAGEAVSAILKRDGPAGFYRGYAGNVARDVPFRILQMCSFELLKSAALRCKARSNPPAARARELSTGEALAVGVASGTFSSVLTTPLDTVKTMLMTGAYEGGVVGCVKKVVAEEGVGGLMRGVGLRVAYIAPSVGIFFVVKEGVEKHLLPKE
ncbi:hypothetical protein TeGR_g14504 [Tetraparma gracilis]|uniref:Mitochondrial carrier protein n=1 Tax=Tetraparma gracilis TaxID=2962635 RepID=A0ABQ6MAX1_9STRA|nr:hypothetical protein TeGR_g14504 [Tetraparma gracilis]